MNQIETTKTHILKLKFYCVSQVKHCQMGTFITFSAEWEKVEQQRVDIGKMF